MTNAPALCTNASWTRRHTAAYAPIAATARDRLNGRRPTSHTVTSARTTPTDSPAACRNPGANRQTSASISTRKLTTTWISSAAAIDAMMEAAIFTK